MQKAIALLVVGLLTPQLSARAGALEGRHLVIAIDAVPFDVMQQAMSRPDARYFADLPAPKPMVSTFPSTTSLALAAILQPIGVERSPGYENRYYDHERNELRGGGLFSYEPFAWRKFFDWKVKGLRRKATSALHPLKAGRADIRKSLQAFERSRQPDFFIYYDATDLAAHLRGPQSLLPILERLDVELDALRRKLGAEAFHVTIFSDHGISGGEPRRNVRGDVLARLEADGFRRRKKLQRSGDFVVVPFGLVSTLSIFTQPEQAVAVARSVARVGGVDLCAAVDGEGWQVEGRDGRSWFERRLQDSVVEWRYGFADSDPLRLPQLAGGWRRDQDVLEQTADHVYPDPLHRIAAAFSLVDNPASVICSLSATSMFGSKLTNFGSRLSGGRLRWTHGALDREDSLGFVVSESERGLHDLVRFDDVLEPSLTLEALQDRHAP